MELDYCRRRDFLFCNLCGTMLTLSSKEKPCCPFCLSKKKLKDVLDKDTCYTVTGEDIRRSLNIEPFVKETDGLNISNVEVTKSMCDDPCPKCAHSPVIINKVAQTRSADEGQSLFLECPECKHTWKADT